MSDTDPRALLDRREYLRLTGGLAAGGAAGLAGCAGDGVLDGDDSGDDDSGDDPATGLLSTEVSDDPGDIGDFESCLVTIDGVWVGPRAAEGGDEGESDSDAEADEDDGDSEDGTDETNQTPTNDSAAGSRKQDEDDEEADGDGGPPQDRGNGSGGGDQEDADEDGAEDGDDEAEDDGEGGRTYYEFEEPQEADLVELQGDNAQLVGEHELEVGTYQFLQLDVSGIEGTLNDGSQAEVETPGNAPLKFNEAFDVREGYRTTFLADFTPVRRGNGSYIFQPVARETEVSYEPIDGGGSEDGDEGDADGSGDDGNGDDSETDGSDGTTDDTADGDGGNSTDDEPAGGDQTQ